MNQTIEDAPLKQFQYDSYDQLQKHLADVVAAYNLARRLKTLIGLTPCEYICKIWTAEPDRFILNPIHQMPGLKSQQTALHSLERGAILCPIARRCARRRVLVHAADAFAWDDVGKEMAKVVTKK